MACKSWWRVAVVVSDKALGFQAGISFFLDMMIYFAFRIMFEQTNGPTVSDLFAWSHCNLTWNSQPKFMPP
jgi:hypothetical protein